MAREDALEFLYPQEGETTVGFLSPEDLINMVNQIYDDIDAAIADAIAGLPPAIE